MHRADAALVVGGHGNGLEHALDLVVGEALGGQPLARTPADQLLRARAGGHPLGLDPGEGPGAALGDDRGSIQGVDLLGAKARYRRRDRLGIARGNRHLRAQAFLLLANPAGDVGGQLLGAQGLAQHDLVDGAVDHLLEARHVDAGLAWVEVDEALQLGEEVTAGGVGGGASGGPPGPSPRPPAARAGPPGPYLPFSPPRAPPGAGRPPSWG